VGSGFLFHPVLTNADAGKEITPRSSYEKLEISKADFDSHWKVVYRVQFLTNAASTYSQ
jgi:hypothetical protein